MSSKAQEFGKFVEKHEAFPYNGFDEFNPKLLCTQPGHYVLMASYSLSVVYVAITNSEGVTTLRELNRNYNGGFDYQGKNFSNLDEFCTGYKQFMPVKHDCGKALKSFNGTIFEVFNGDIRPIRAHHNDAPKSLWWTGGSWVSEQGIHPFVPK